MPTETLEKFFTGKKFIIPPYQRDYAWETQQIDELFEDISEALQTETNHYIGTFILSKSEKETFYKIVDGQQRLTTLTMLLDALIDQLDDRLRILYSYVFLSNEDLSKKLTLLGENGHFFAQLLDKKTPQPKSKAQERLRDGYIRIRQRVDKLFSDGGKDGILNWVGGIKSLEALEFIEPNEGKAIRMFQSVNDRGVLLSHMDKAKSAIIYYSNRFLGGEFDEFVNTRFGDCFKSYSEIKNLASEAGFTINNIDRKTFTEDDVLRYHYLAFDPLPYDPEAGFDFKATSDFVLNEFLKTSLKRLRDNRENLKTFINSYVNDLAQFFTALRQLVEATRKSEALFQLFVILDLSASLYPLTIRLQTRNMLTDGAPGSSGHSLLSLIEITDLRVYKLRGTNPVKDIFEISRAAQGLSTDDIANRLREFVQYFMSNELFANSLANGPLYGNPGLYRILTEVEKDARKKIGGLSLADLQAMVLEDQSIEHVLPQSPDFGFPSYGFASHEEYEQANDRLGNLTLLTKAENSRCNNRPVEEKIHANNLYASSIYYSTRQIAADGAGSTSPFTKGTIEERSRKIAEFCRERWPLWELVQATDTTSIVQQQEGEGSKGDDSDCTEQVAESHETSCGLEEQGWSPTKERENYDKYLNAVKTDPDSATKLLGLWKYDSNIGKVYEAIMVGDWHALESLQRQHVTGKLTVSDYLGSIRRTGKRLDLWTMEFRNSKSEVRLLMKKCGDVATAIDGNGDDTDEDAAERGAVSEEALIAESQQHGTLPLLNICREVKGLWFERCSKTYGGSFRYRVDKPGLIGSYALGVNVGSKLRESARGELLAWMNPIKLAELLSIPEERIREIIAREFTSRWDKSPSTCVITLKTEGDANKLVTTLMKFSERSGVQEPDEVSNKNLKTMAVPSVACFWWPTVDRFALTLNGYKAIGEDECSELANRVRSEFDKNVEYLQSLSLTELRACLFFEQRRFHHFNDEPKGANRTYINALLDAIRSRART